MKTENYKELCTLLDINVILLNTLKSAYRHMKEVFRGIGLPQGYSAGTSYLDADTIHGGKEEGITSMENAYAKLQAFPELIARQEEIVDELKKAKEDIDKLLEGDISILIKVSLLRTKGFTQEEVAELVERSTSTIKRIDKKVKNDTKNDLLQGV